MADIFDVVVIGGGIHGVGVAQAAAVGGYHVRLLEQGQLASGTSSRSSKLVHGGLRYLQSGQWRLVRESLREREILLAIAPGLVERRAFHIPVYAGGPYARWQVVMGLRLYRWLAGPRGGFTRLPRRQWATLDGLNTGGLTAVYRYTDAQTDDALLTQAVARSAADYGADIQVNTRFLGAERTPQGYDIRYVQAGIVRSCQSQTLVNAAGPWVGQVLGSILPAPPRFAYDLVRGAHIITDGTLAQGIYYVPSPADGRPVFVMPWQGRVLTGTTETLYGGDPSAVTPSATDIAYLQGVLGCYFPALPTVVRAAFAGLRVLPRSDQHVHRRIRETIIIADAPRPRLLTIYGGKLTGYRLTAARVMDRLRLTLPERTALADTQRLRLTRP